MSFYLKQSPTKTLVAYDKLRELKAKNNALANLFGLDDELTRVEVQLKGAAVPFKKIGDLERYASVDLLPGLEFRELRRLPKGTKPLHRLASEGLRHLIRRYGLQAAKKQLPPSDWAYVERVLLRPIEDAELLDVRRLMRRSVDDWLNNRIRFPRGRTD